VGDSKSRVNALAPLDVVQRILAPAAASNSSALEVPALIYAPPPDSYGMEIDAVTVKVSMTSLGADSVTEWIFPVTIESVADPPAIRAPELIQIGEQDVFEFKFRN